MMHKFLLTIGLITVVFLQNPIFSLFFGMTLSLISKKGLKEFTESIGSLPLQIGIVLIGFSISFEAFSMLITKYFPIISIFVIFTFILGLSLGRVLNIDKRFIYLISSATAICGATAALAISSIIKANPNQISSTLFIVFVMNGLALALFPIIGKYLGFTDLQFGLFSALAIHDTASVVGSGLLFSEDAGEIAATLKVVRTMWIIPLILFFTYTTSVKRSLNISYFPKFIFFFFVALVVSNILSLPNQVFEITSILSIIFINVGIFFVGLQTNIKKITNSSLLVYPILLWATVVSLSFIVVTSL